jgi:hypothetical protein
MATDDKKSTIKVKSEEPNYSEPNQTYRRRSQPNIATQPPTPWRPSEPFQKTDAPR